MGRESRRGNPPVPEALREATRRNFEKVSGSTCFCVLFNEKMVEDVLPLIQMGLAVYLDKPIVMLVPKGALVPGNLRAMAVKIEEFDPNQPGDIEAATMRLAKNGFI